jgi:cell division protein FtsI/penicillin-binding protein 2
VRKPSASAKRFCFFADESRFVIQVTLQLARLAVTILLSSCCSAVVFPQDSKLAQKLRPATEKAMAGRPGALVVADVVSGKILAARGLDIASHRTRRPGSTLKPFVLMALLESGRLDASQKLLCRRPLRIGGLSLDCTHPPTMLDFDAEEAIAYSCNSYFAEVATRLSGPELVQAFRKAGLDSPSGFVKDEASGRIEQPSDRERLQLEALGDRGVEVSPLELLEAYRKLALQKRKGDAGADAPVFAGLEQSVEYGMAHAASVDGMKIAGKTGTAASRESVKTHGFFVGYAPAEKPEIVLVVFLEQGRGADAAAIVEPIFAEFARERRAP